MSGNKKISMSKQNKIKILEVSIPNELNMKINFDETKIQPLRICTKAGVNGWVYARKTAGAKVSGNIKSKLGDFNLDELNLLGHNDFSMGFMRPETFWNWSLLMGEVDKNIFSVNLSAGVNETEFSENCCWMNGELFTLPQVSFYYDKKNLMKPWNVKSNNEDVILEFIPEGLYQEKINAYILASNFYQVYGKYNGQIQLNGKTIEVKNFYGYAEDHYAKW